MRDEALAMRREISLERRNDRRQHAANALAHVFYCLNSIKHQTSHFIILPSNLRLRRALLFSAPHIAGVLLFSALHVIPGGARAREDRSTATAMRLDSSEPQKHQPFGYLSWMNST